MFIIPGEWHASFAAFREEPAKLIAVILIFFYYQKTRKIYGLSGLVIGAAIGAGFGAFESMTYALNISSDILNQGVGALIQNQIQRGLFSLGGHILFCVPYAAELALNTKKEKIKAESFLNKSFMGAFGFSILCHFLWNGYFFENFQYILYYDYGVLLPVSMLYIHCSIVVILLWIQALRVVRKCLKQAVEIGQYQPGSGRLYDSENRYYTISDQKNAVISQVNQIQGSIPNLMVSRIENGVENQVYQSNNSETITVGRASDCGIQFPLDARGVSRRHMSIQYTGYSWTVRDLGSTNGTYVSDGVRLSPYTDWKLQSGEIIWVGDKENSLRISIY